MIPINMIRSMITKVTISIVLFSTLSACQPWTVQPYTPTIEGYENNPS